jgi:hypothetical protein
MSARQFSSAAPTSLSLRTIEARHVYAVLDDPEDKDSKLFVKAKNNLARDTKALRYGISVKTVGHDSKLGVDITAPYIIWHPQHEAMQAAGGHTAKREAREIARCLTD